MRVKGKQTDDKHSRVSLFLLLHAIKSIGQPFIYSLYTPPKRHTARFRPAPKAELMAPKSKNIRHFCLSFHWCAFHLTWLAVQRHNASVWLSLRWTGTGTGADPGPLEVSSGKVFALACQVSCMCVYVGLYVWLRISCMSECLSIKNFFHSFSFCFLIFSKEKPLSR